MCEFVDCVGAQQALQTRFIAQLFEILMVHGHMAGAQELDDTGIGQRIEIAAKQQLYVIRIVFVIWSQAVIQVVKYRFQLIAQHHRLDQFDVAEFWIPVNVRGAHENRLRDVHLIGRQTFPC